MVSCQHINIFTSNEQKKPTICGLPASGSLMKAAGWAVCHVRVILPFNPSWRRNTAKSFLDLYKIREHFSGNLPVEWSTYRQVIVSKQSLESTAALSVEIASSASHVLLNERWYTIDTVYDNDDDGLSTSTRSWVVTGYDRARTASTTRSTSDGNPVQSFAFCLHCVSNFNLKYRKLNHFHCENESETNSIFLTLPSWAYQFRQTTSWGSGVGQGDGSKEVENYILWRFRKSRKFRKLIFYPRLG